MLTKNNILIGLLVDIFLFVPPSVALDIGTRIYNEAGFTKIELSAMQEMGWSNKRLVKYADIACGYIVDGKLNSLQSLYKYYFGDYNPSKVPYIRNSLRKIHNWAKKQPECN